MQILILHSHPNNNGQLKQDFRILGSQYHLHLDQASSKTADGLSRTCGYYVDKCSQAAFC